MVDLLDKNAKEPASHLEKGKKPTLGERVGSFVSKTLNKLSQRKDTLSMKVVIETTEELSTLHNQLEAQAAIERAEIATEELQQLQAGVETLKKETAEVFDTNQPSSDTHMAHSTIQRDNIALGVDISSLGEQGSLIGRAQAANAVAARIETELFDPRYWSLL